MHSIGAIQSIFDHVPGVWVAKDLHSRIVYCSRETAHMNGLHDPDDLLGLTDYDLPSRLSECAEIFRNQDMMVIDLGQTLKVIDVLETDEGDWKVYSGTKTILSDHQGKIAGTIFHAQDITNQQHIEICKILTQTSAFADRHHLKKRLETFFLGML